MVLLKNFTQIPNELFQSKTLTSRSIALYSYLKYRGYVGNGEQTFPSQKRIMNDLRIGSDNTLRKAIQELIVNEFLIVERGSNYTGNSLYKLRIPSTNKENTS